VHGVGFSPEEASAVYSVLRNVQCPGKSGRYLSCGLASEPATLHERFLAGERAGRGNRTRRAEG